MWTAQSQRRKEEEAQQQRTSRLLPQAGGLLDVGFTDNVGETKAGLHIASVNSERARTRQSVCTFTAKSRDNCEGWLITPDI